MARLIDQTRNAIDDLVACGLKRTEFRVRTPYVGGRLSGHYDRAQISLRCSRARQLEVLEALAQRFICHIAHRSGEFLFVAVSPAYGTPDKDYLDLDVHLDGVDVATDEGFAAHMAFRAAPATLRLP